jgi:dTDP-4-dehydrorhamnose reductase
MRVLVAGWHGQIALALSAEAARRDDVEAYAVGRPALDLTDRPSIGRTLFGISPDVIINTAAYTDVEGAELEPERAHRRNSIGAAALASQARRIGVPIIHLSTVYVFDGKKDKSYDEDDNTHPVNAYGRSKRAGEEAVVAANPQHIILRTGWVYSSHGRNFVTGMLERGSRSAELRVDQTQRGSPSYAPHIATAILDVASKIVGAQDDALWGTYHLANHGAASWYDLACQTFREVKKSGVSVPVIRAVDGGEVSHRAARPVNATLDCSKLSRTFGINLANWQEAVAECVREIKDADSVTT